MRKPLLILLALLLSCVAVQAEPIPLRDLASGKPVSAVDKSGGRVGVIYIAAPPEVVWQTVSNWSRLADILPAVAGNTVVWQAKDKRAAVVEGRFEIDNFAAQYSLYVKSDPARYRQEWRMLTSDEVGGFLAKNILVHYNSGLLAKMQGYQIVWPYGDGSLYYYAPTVTCSIPLPEYTKAAIDSGIYLDQLKLVKNSIEDGLAAKR